MMTKHLPSKPLYEISNDYEQALNALALIEDQDSEEALAARATIDQLSDSGNKKSIATAMWIENVKVQQAGITEAIKRMQDRKKRLEKVIEDREQYLKDNMERLGISHIHCPYFDIKLKKNPPKVDILNESEVPEEYMRTKIERSIDKSKASFEMKEGVVIPGLRLIQETKLEIK